MERRDFLLSFPFAAAVTTTKVATATQLDGMFSQFIEVVPTMADLRTMTPSQDGTVVWLSGSGQGFFLWFASSNDAGDGGTVIQPDAGSQGRWKRAWESSVNVKWFGAKGDGVADDTAAIQAAIDNAAMGTTSESKGGVRLPPGTYLVSSQIVVKNKVELRGAGKRATVIKATNTFPSGTAVVRLGATSEELVFDCALHDLGVDCNGVAGSIGVYSQVAQEGSGLFNCQVIAFINKGIYFNQCSGVSLSNVEVLTWLPVDAVSIGIHIVQNALSVRIERVTVVGPSTGNKLASCVRVSGSWVSLLDCHFEQGTTGLYLDQLAQATVVNVVGHNTLQNSVNDLIKISDGNISVIAMNLFNKGNLINDVWYSRVIPGLTLPFFVRQDNSAPDVRFYFNGMSIMSYWGSPEGARTAPAGSVYFQLDGGAGRTLWVKESGNGNTGWRSK